MEVEIQNENHFAALDDEPIYENEGLKDSVTAQACQDLDLGLAELFEVKESTEATEISGSILAHEVKSLYRRYASISWFLFHLMYQMVVLEINTLILLDREVVSLFLSLYM